VQHMFALLAWPIEWVMGAAALIAFIWLLNRMG